MDTTFFEMLHAEAHRPGVLPVLVRGYIQGTFDTAVMPDREHGEAWANLEPSLLASYALSVGSLRRRLLSWPGWSREQVAAVRAELSRAGQSHDSYHLLACACLTEADQHSILDDVLLVRRSIVSRRHQQFRLLPDSITERLSPIVKQDAFAWMPTRAVPTSELVKRATGTATLDLRILQAAIEREDITAQQRWRLLRRVRRELSRAQDTTPVRTLEAACVYLRTDDPAAHHPQTAIVGADIAPTQLLADAVRTLLSSEADASNCVRLITAVANARPAMVDTVLLPALRAKNVPLAVLAGIRTSTEFSRWHTKLALSNGIVDVLADRAVRGDRAAAAALDPGALANSLRNSLWSDAGDAAIENIPWPQLSKVPSRNAAVATVAADLGARPGGDHHVLVFNSLLSSHEGTLGELRDAVVAAAAPSLLTTP